MDVHRSVGAETATRAESSRPSRSAVRGRWCAHAEPGKMVSGRAATTLGARLLLSSRPKADLEKNVPVCRDARRARPRRGTHHRRTVRSRAGGPARARAGIRAAGMGRPSACKKRRATSPQQSRPRVGGRRQQRGPSAHRAPAGTANRRTSRLRVAARPAPTCARRQGTSAAGPCPLALQPLALAQRALVSDSRRLSRGSAPAAVVVTMDRRGQARTGFPRRSVQRAARAVRPHFRRAWCAGREIGGRRRRCRL